MYTDTLLIIFILDKVEKLKIPMVALFLHKKNKFGSRFKNNICKAIRFIKKDIKFGIMTDVAIPVSHGMTELLMVKLMLKHWSFSKQALLQAEVVQI